MRSFMDYTLHEKLLREEMIEAKMAGARKENGIYKNFGRNTRREISLERPACKWKDNIKINLK
jgi:hypothetical protein